MNRYFKIADFTFSIELPDCEEFSIPSNFLLFEHDSSDASDDILCDVSDDILPDVSYSYHVNLVDHLPETDGKLIAQRDDLLVYENHGLERRVIGFHGENVFYACYLETSENSAEIYFLRSMIGELYLDTMFNSLFALEKRMMEHEVMILHCAYINNEGKAILFSAPSETGKSTQAELWSRYRGSRIINGDRGVLKKCGGSWYVCGWPVCGSSEICHNESAPVHAIVMLSQAKVNQASRLRPMEAFRQLYSQITVNGWNQEAVNHTMDLIESLISDVPVYHLACDISKNAVDTLAEVLL